MQEVHDESERKVRDAQEARDGQGMGREHPREPQMRRTHAQDIDRRKKCWLEQIASRLNALRREGRWRGSQSEREINKTTINAFH